MTRMIPNHVNNVLYMVKECTAKLYTPFFEKDSNGKSENG